MAVDTKDKRFSMLSFGSGELLPDPDGGFDGPDRQHLLECYAGIAFQGPPPLVGVSEWHWLYRRIPRF